MKSPLQVKPSMFAATLCYEHACCGNQKYQTVCDSVASGALVQSSATSNTGQTRQKHSRTITSFDFSSPSPDDIVTERQKAAFGKTAPGKYFSAVGIAKCVLPLGLQAVFIEHVHAHQY